MNWGMSTYGSRNSNVRYGFMVKVSIDEIKVIQDLYPRMGHSQAIVDSYRKNIEGLPPIVVSKDLVLVDGYHRYLAFRLEGKREIEAEIVDIPADRVLFEAAKYNSKHGWQLSLGEKRKLAIKFFLNDYDAKEIADCLSASIRTVQKWTEELRQEGRKERDEEIYKLYFEAEYTQEEIAPKMGLAQNTVSVIIKKRMDALIDKEPQHLQITDFWELPSPSLPHVLENLLWYQTKVGDSVYDLHKSLETRQVCKSMARKYTEEMDNADLVIFHNNFNQFTTAKQFHDFVKDFALNCNREAKPNVKVAIYTRDDLSPLKCKELHFLPGIAWEIFREYSYENIFTAMIRRPDEEIDVAEVEAYKSMPNYIIVTSELLVFRK